MGRNPGKPIIVITENTSTTIAPIFFLPGWFITREPMIITMPNNNDITPTRKMSASNKENTARKSNARPASTKNTDISGRERMFSILKMNISIPPTRDTNAPLPVLFFITTGGFIWPCGSRAPVNAALIST